MAAGTDARSQGRTSEFLLFDVSDAPTPANLCQQGGNWSAGPEGLEPELGEAFLAGGLVVHVVDEVVLATGDAEQVSELVPDPGNVVGVQVFMLAHLAAGIGNQQRNAARVAGAGVDNDQRVAEAAAMEAFWFRRE